MCSLANLLGWKIAGLLVNSRVSVLWFIRETATQNRIGINCMLQHQTTRWIEYNAFGLGQSICGIIRGHADMGIGHCNLLIYRGDFWGDVQLGEERRALPPPSSSSVKRSCHANWSAASSNCTCLVYLSFAGAYPHVGATSFAACTASLSAED